MPPPAPAPTAATTHPAAGVPPASAAATQARRLVFRFMSKPSPSSEPGAERCRTVPANAPGPSTARLRRAWPEAVLSRSRNRCPGGAILWYGTDHRLGQNVVRGEARRRRDLAPGGLVPRCQHRRHAGRARRVRAPSHGAARRHRVTAPPPRSLHGGVPHVERSQSRAGHEGGRRAHLRSVDRKSTRLNSSHITISYAVFCLKKKK